MGVPFVGGLLCFAGAARRTWVCAEVAVGGVGGRRWAHARLHVTLLVSGSSWTKGCVTLACCLRRDVWVTSVQAVDGQRRIAVGGPRQLALLLMYTTRAPSSGLIDTLWDDLGRTARSSARASRSSGRAVRELRRGEAAVGAGGAPVAVAAAEHGGRDGRDVDGIKRFDAADQ
jgi:hypothetical protein